MKISIESHLLNHHQRSGVLTYSEGLVNGLEKNDSFNEYSLLFYSMTRMAFEMPGPVSDRFRKYVLRVPDQNFWLRQDFLDKFVLPRFLKRKKINVFHRLAGRTLPECPGVYKVLTIHDLRTFAIGDPLFDENIERYKIIANKADICTVVSESTKQDVLKYLGIPEKKIKVIYLGVGERFSPANSQEILEVREKYGLGNIPYWLAIGSVPRKNIEGILRGFAGSNQRASSNLILVCRWNLNKYKNLARELGIQERTIFIPDAPDDDLRVLYSGCFCFLFPSLYEGFGLPILEAMACGAPVITSTISSCPEVAGDAAILVNPQNIGEITSAIDELYRDKPLRDKFITRGFERIKMFSWKRFGHQMKEIYSLA